MKLSYIILGGIVAIVIYLAVNSYPDIIRYQRIRDM
jgi:hypothetical protein